MLLFTYSLQFIRVRHIACASWWFMTPCLLKGIFLFSNASPLFLLFTVVLKLPLSESVSLSTGLSVTFAAFEGKTVDLEGLVVIEARLDTDEAFIFDSSTTAAADDTSAENIGSSGSVVVLGPALSASRFYCSKLPSKFLNNVDGLTSHSICLKLEKYQTFNSICSYRCFMLFAVSKN